MALLGDKKKKKKKRNGSSKSETIRLKKFLLDTKDILLRINFY